VVTHVGLDVVVAGFEVHNGRDGADLIVEARVLQEGVQLLHGLHQVGVQRGKPLFGGLNVRD